MRTQPVSTAFTPPVVDMEVASYSPAELLQTPQKDGQSALYLRIIAAKVGEHTDAPHALLGPRPHRPRSRRATEECEERAARGHSMTSSASRRNASEIERPSDLAVLRLMINS